MSHLRRFARGVQHDLWPTPEQAVLRELERRAGQEARRTAGRIAIPPYRFAYVDAMTAWPQWDDIFVHQSLAFSSTAREPRILDCGANIGLASLYFKRTYPQARITAFEADPELAVVCRGNMEDNDAGDVDVRAAAVWTTGGTVQFVADGTDSGSIASVANVEGRTMQVAAVRLRDWLNEPIDLLKLDIEGAESIVLADCADHLQHVRSMAIDLHEFDPARRQTGTLFDVLTRAGFMFDMQSLVSLPWRSGGASSPFPAASPVWAALVRAWRP